MELESPTIYNVIPTGKQCYAYSYRLILVNYSY